MTETRSAGHDVVVSTEGALVSAVASGPASRPSLEPLAIPTRALASEPELRARSFRALYDSHVDFVWRNLRRLGVPESETEDRTQEVFVVAHRRFDEFEDRGHGPRAWLFQIILRVASDARRHRRRHPEDPDGGDATSRASVAPTQGDALARREALWQLDAALEMIDVGRRAVLVLHEIEEMTAPEIAHVLAIPLNTVYSRLRVARVELEAALARRGGER
ncbi:MAG TPA: sigma-70 family RNA polymerase sigma factor [Polyangiaceae bacterium]|nr:sigma-70 family RNA polymerase sigma factor [Polyangiaceae bacterium]